MKNYTLLILIMLSTHLFAQDWVQLGADIDGDSDYDYFGYRVSLSSDGLTLAAGAYQNDDNGTNAGCVKVFHNDNGTWTQIGGNIYGEAAQDQSGRAIGLSADGTTVAIGAMYNSGSGTNAGHVRVYKNIGGTWTQIGNDIDGDEPNDFSGYSVSLNSDGSIVAIGSVNANSGAGEVKVFQNNSGTWTQIGSDIIGEAPGDFSGYSVSLNADGTIVAIGAYKNSGNGTYAGHVRVYQNNGGTWTQIGNDIDGEAAGDYSGSAISLNADGSIVAIGAYANDGNGTDAGHVRVFHNNAGSWEQMGDDIDGEAAGDFFGRSVSLDAAGTKIAIGADNNNSNGNRAGQTKIYEYTGGVWTQVGNSINGEAANDLSGTSVSLNSDGTVVAIGAPGNDGNGGDAVGQVRVYKNETHTQWTTATDVNTLVTESLSEDMQAIGTSDGQTYVVYWKAVSAPQNYELRLQLLDASGDRQFGDEGMLVSNNIPMSTFTMAWSIAIDDNDNLYIGVTGTSDYSGYVYKIDKNGNLLWGSNGINLGTGFNIKLLPLSSGDVLVSWISGNQALLQKYDSNGNAVWSSPQTILNGSNKTAPGDMFELSDGGCIVVFHSYNYGVNSTLYAQRYDANGNAQWSSPVQLSDKTTRYNEIYSGTQDGDTVYYGYYGAAGLRYDAFLQRINPDGTLPWGINGMDFDTNETDYENNIKIAYSNGSQYVWAICSYSNSSYTEYGEYIQKFDKVTGARQFTDNAKPIYPVSNNFNVHASGLQLINDNPFFLLKKGYDDGTSPTTLGVLLLDDNGNFVWNDETQPVATYPANKKRTHLTKTVNNQSVAVFIEDKSDGLKIYAQNFIQGTYTPAPPVLISPQNNETDVPLDVTFSWNSVFGADTYHIQIAEEDTFTNILVDDSAITTPSYNFTLPDNSTTYYWRVNSGNTAGDSDWSDIWSFTTVSSTGINEIENIFKIYPNPAKNYFTIETGQKVKGEIYTLEGKLVKIISTQEINVPIDISNLPESIYLLKLTNLEGEVVGFVKIVKK